MYTHYYRSYKQKTAIEYTTEKHTVVLLVLGRHTVLYQYMNNEFEVVTSFGIAPQSCRHKLLPMRGRKSN